MGARERLLALLCWRWAALVLPDPDTAADGPERRYAAPKLAPPEGSPQTGSPGRPEL